MTPPEDNEAARLIENHIATLNQHKGQLERALAHLNGTADEEGQSRRGRGRGKGRRGPGRSAQTGGADRGQAATGERRAPRGARRREVIADLKSNPGSRAVDVAQRVGINPTHAQSILANLVKQGVAGKEGQQFTIVSD